VQGRPSGGRPSGWPMINADMLAGRIGREPERDDLQKSSDPATGSSLARAAMARVDRILRTRRYRPMVMTLVGRLGPNEGRPQHARRCAASDKRPAAIGRHDRRTWIARKRPLSSGVAMSRLRIGERHRAIEIDPEGCVRPAPANRGIAAFEMGVLRSFERGGASGREQGSGRLARPRGSVERLHFGLRHRGGVSIASSPTGAPVAPGMAIGQPAGAARRSRGRLRSRGAHRGAFTRLGPSQGRTRS